MKLDFYLIVDKRGNAKIRQNKPSVSWDEISIKMNLQLPDSLFTKPQITASIQVPQDKVSSFQITSEVTDNLKEAIEQHVGLPIKITIGE